MTERTPAETAAEALRRALDDDQSDIRHDVRYAMHKALAALTAESARVPTVTDERMQMALEWMRKVWLADDAELPDGFRFAFQALKEFSQLKEVARVSLDREALAREIEATIADLTQVAGQVVLYTGQGDLRFEIEAYRLNGVIDLLRRLSSLPPAPPRHRRRSREHPGRAAGVA